MSSSNPHLPLGRTVITPEALQKLPVEEVYKALTRHESGDWGDLSAEDKEANDLALISGARLLSAYKAMNGIAFWIITEADRSVTTVLLPSEY